MAELIIEVPDELAARIAEALRHRYTDLIRSAYPAGGETDAQATRAVIGWLIADILSGYESEKVRAVKEPALEAARADLESSVRRARKAAQDAIAEVMGQRADVPTEPTEEPTEEPPGKQGGKP